MTPLEWGGKSRRKRNKDNTTAESWLFNCSFLKKHFEIHMTIMSSQLYRLLSNKESINCYREAKHYPYCFKTNLIHSGKLFPYMGSVWFNDTGKYHQSPFAGGEGTYGWVSKSKLRPCKPPAALGTAAGSTGSHSGPPSCKAQEPSWVQNLAGSLWF